MTNANQKRGILYMTICGALWSIAGIFIKLIPWHALTIAGFRSLVAGLSVAVFMLFTKRKFLFNRQSLLSGVFLCLTFLSFVSANKLTTAANAIVLQFTAPVFILILSALFLGQSFRRADVITVVLTLGGISLFFFDSLSPGNLLGNIVGIMAGFFMAIMYICVGRCDDECRMSGILLGHLFTALVGIPTMFLFDTPFTPAAVSSILILGLVQLGIPYILYGLAIQYCSPLMCSLIGAVEPLLNPVWVAIFDGEVPGLFALLGGVVVIATISVWCVWNSRQLPVEDAA